MRDAGANKGEGQRCELGTGACQKAGPAAANGLRLLRAFAMADAGVGASGHR